MKKKIIIDRCDEYLYLLSRNIIEGNINTEIHECELMGKKEVLRETVTSFDSKVQFYEKIEIPEWCPLEND